MTNFILLINEDYMHVYYVCVRARVCERDVHCKYVQTFMNYLFTNQFTVQVDELGVLKGSEV